MAERMSKRTDRLTGTGSTEDILMGKSIKERKTKKPKERWLLTRKTWRYMADAGRKLIPEGAHNRPEDIPKIEAYFQEVCRRESGFMLWRKNSYPGALGFRSHRKRKDRRKGGSCRKASSADEIEEIIERPKTLPLSTSGGRIDIQKLKHDFFNRPVQKSSFGSRQSLDVTPAETPEERQLLDLLEKILAIQKESPSTSTRTDWNYHELVDKLQRHLSLVNKSTTTVYPSISPRRQNVQFEGDHVQKSLSETLSRYFSHSPNRDKIISDLLTDRKELEKLYFELRKTKGFRGGGRGGNYAWSPSLLRHYGNGYQYEDSDGKSETIPPPLIEIHGESSEPSFENWGVQTDPLPESQLQQIEEEYKKSVSEKEEEVKEMKHMGFRRRSSVDNDDVSQSVSDTIKRYLRMARKKSVDSDKADRFKRINYDRNLRNIKPKGELTKPGDDGGLNKGCQTNDEWILTFRDLKFEVVSDQGSRMTSSRSSIDAGIVEDFNKSTPTSPTGFLSSGQSFLSHLLHGKHDKTSTATVVGAMQKSKSSSSVMHHGSRLVAKKIFRSRSKSQSRTATLPSNWTPQGNCVWNSVSGRQVILGDANLLHLTEIERKVLQKVALAKLQALNLGVAIKVPAETTATVPQKPKRRAYLLKRKALTTGFFDARKDGEKDKDGSAPGGLVFSIPLSQCVENDRLSRAASGGNSFRNRELSGSGDEPGLGRTASRASFSSLIDAPRDDESGSCESLMSRERIVGSVPGLLDRISCGSTADITVNQVDDEPAVPNILNVCLRHLEAHGLHTLGIFRVSTSKKRVRQLREDFDCGKENSLDEDQCPHDVATLLKEYLRDLPDPLLCRDLYHAFIQTQRIRNRRLQFEALQHLIQLLPPPNRDTLAALLNFLATVARYANDQIDASGENVSGNKMDSNNLATVFAPNVLHCTKPGSSGKDERPEDRLDVINVCRILIDHNRMLFNIPAELLDEVYVHMMDLHPEVLDQLLNKREATAAADESLEDLDSESNSAPWTPTTTATFDMDTIIPDGRKTPPEPRKTWSREEFLHETAATGGPNVGMRIRHKERIRNSKKRRDESSSRRRRDDEGMGMAMNLISKLRGRVPEDFHDDPNEINRVLRLAEEDRRKSYVLDDSGVITASLTIPVQSAPLSLNLDDNDIPYIEDGGGYANLEGTRLTIGLVRTPSVPPRRRQRSISGSDSSVGSFAQPITGSISFVTDSAVGSSATSPPQNTSPPSVSSSADVIYSSPPSWASSPPTSPDSMHTSVNYIPDDIQPPKTITKRKESAILQKVSFTSTSELQQVKQSKMPDTQKLQVAPEVQKSLSSPAVAKVPEQKLTPSITSIGNAVLRSRTADFERIAKTEAKPTKTVTSVVTSSGSDKKKYTKRRYTDSRHQTRHIPDSETLEAASNLQKKEEKAATVQAGPVYKRRELISSVPSK